jgi:transcription initiation factor TFIIB
MLSTREKNLKLGMTKIDEIASRLSLPEFIITESKLIFKKSLYSNISIGRDNISLIYARIYMACSIHELPKTLTEITAYSEVESKDLMNAYRRIKRSLSIGTKLIDPMDLLPRFASKLELDTNTTK